MAELVSVGVPVYRGQSFIAETLRSIQNQTHRDIDVLISVDGADHESAEACAPFLRDSRFRLVVQERHLGWPGNASWLMSQNTSAFWYLHPHDDLVAPTYVSALLDYASAHPAAAVVYCDIAAFGTLDAIITQPSVQGDPALREIILLAGHSAAVAFRGLTRREALEQSRGVKVNEVESFGADTAWMASVARGGELLRLPQCLYYKRYHRDNTHTRWLSWPLERKMLAWQVHCRDMFLEAAQANATVQERRLMWCTTLVRLVTGAARGYLPVDVFAHADRRAMLTGFFEKLGARVDTTEALLESRWSDVLLWSEQFFTSLNGR